MKENPNQPPEVMTTVDKVAIGMLLMMLVVYCVGAANDNQVLIWTANLVIGLPGIIMKVRSPRAKSRWWYEHGDAWRARQKENQPQN